MSASTRPYRQHVLTETQYFMNQTQGLEQEKPQMSDDVRYEIILFWSEEDQAIIAEVPELPGCAADGATYQEALANVQTIIAEWIETAQELGRAIPQPKGRLMFA
jgi:predicted RNase H-like HicB family nuclease